MCQIGHPLYSTLNFQISDFSLQEYISRFQFSAFNCLFSVFRNQFSIFSFSVFNLNSQFSICLDSIFSLSLRTYGWSRILAMSNASAIKGWRLRVRQKPTSVLWNLSQFTQRSGACSSEGWIWSHTYSSVAVDLCRWSLPPPLHERTNLHVHTLGLWGKGGGMKNSRTSSADPPDNFWHLHPKGI